jgi:hypothetical protein
MWWTEDIKSKYLRVIVEFLYYGVAGGICLILFVGAVEYFYPNPPKPPHFEIGTLNDETAVYWDNREREKRNYTIHKGNKVRILDINFLPETVNSEALAKVMLINKDYDFVNGIVVCVPKRKIIREHWWFFN